jgi:alpha-2,8-polysialyltransferase (POLYST)
MKNILFAINTEYHVFVITSLIGQLYSDESQYHVTVLLHVNAKGNRFKNKLNFDALGVELVVLEIDVASRVHNPKVKETLDYVLSKPYEKLILFLEQVPINQYLINKLSPKGTTICIAPEGTKPYITISKAAIPSRFKATLKNYLFFKTQKLSVNKLYIISNKNGFLKQTDEVWINHPESYKNVTRKKVVPISLYTSEAETKKASEIFNFDISKEMPETEGVLFYINQWYVEFKVYDYELQMLQAILDKYPEKKIYIKLHPNTHAFQIAKFEKMDRIVVNRSTIPAELFLINLKKSIVFSFWSAALLTENPSCKFYWLDKLLEKQKLMDWWSIVNPTKHIKEVENLYEIQF